MSEDKYYFKQMEHATPAKSVANACFRDASSADSIAIMKLNGLSQSETIYPGQTLVFSSRSSHNESTAPLANGISTKLAHHFRHATTAPQPRSFNRSFNLAALAPSGADYASMGLGISLQAVTTRSEHFLKNIAPALDKLSKIGDAAVDVHLGNMALRSGNLSSVERGLLLSRKAALFKQVKDLPTALKTINPGVGSAADAATMQLDDLARHFRLAGGATSANKASALIGGVNTQIMESVKTSNRLLIPLDASSNLAESIAKQATAMQKILKASEKVGPGLTAVSAAYDMYSMRQTAREADRKFGGVGSEVVYVHQSSKIGGGVIFGAAGSAAAGSAMSAAVPLLALGPVGWAGFAAVAIVSIGGAYALSKAGSHLGGVAGEKMLKAAAPNLSSDVDQIIDFSNDPVSLD